MRILERRLAQLHYLLRGVDSFYSYDTADAVLAFQKVNGLARTGRVTPLVWRRLQTAHAPRPRYRYGHHIEVDKSKQVLFEVDHGRVVRVVHVSTGATGNTPVGLWHIYSKVPGTLPTGMFDSNFFLRGFAIHGYPSVPTYPASHGCVRTPILGGPDPLRLELLRRADLHLLLASPRCWAGSWRRLSSSSSSCRTERATRSPGAMSRHRSHRC